MLHRECEVTLLDFEQQKGPEPSNRLCCALQNFKFVPLNVDLYELDVIEAIVVEPANRNRNSLTRTRRLRETRMSCVHHAGDDWNEKVSPAIARRQRHLM